MGVYLAHLSQIERLVSSPKRTLKNTHLDSVSMSAFGHKQSFRFYAYTCILTVNERLLSAISGHSHTLVILAYYAGMASATIRNNYSMRVSGKEN